jgi:hypothetical protein
MLEETLHFTRGLNKQLVSSELLEHALQGIDGLAGECFFGYPLLATPDGKYSIDATLVSRDKGIVLFDLVEGSSVGDYQTRQDDLANKIEARLKLQRDLVRGRKLRVPLSVVTFAPGASVATANQGNEFPLADELTLAAVLEEIEWDAKDEDLYRLTLSAIESLSSIRKSRSKREAVRPDSRGAKLKN